MTADVVDDLLYEHYVYHEPSMKGLPLNVFEAQPFAGHRFVTMHVQPESETNASVLWEGEVFHFRKALDDAGVKHAYANGAADGQHNKYYRIIRNFDVSSKDCLEMVQNVLDKVFCNIAMQCVVGSAPVEGSDVESWISGLRRLDFLHFVHGEQELA